MTFNRYHFLVMGTFALLLGALFHYLPVLINPEHSVKDAHFRILWSHHTKKQILTAPVLSGDTLVFGCFDGTLMAISATDGHELWSFKLPDYVFSITKDNKGVVYAGTGMHESKRGVLTAIDPATGRIFWQREFEGHLEEPPVIDDERHQMWIGTGPGGLWSVDTRDGSVLWHSAIGHVDGTPLLNADTLYIPAQKDEVVHESFFYALNAADGKILWKLDQPGQPWAAPVMDKTGGIILTTTGDGQIGRVRPTDKGWAYGVSPEGKSLWKSVLSTMPMTPGVYIPESGLIIFTLKNGKVTALNIADGSVTWEAQVAQKFSSAAVPVAGFKEKLIAATADDGVFSLIDAGTGSVMFTTKIANTAGAEPIINKGIIYVTTTFGITAVSDKI